MINSSFHTTTTRDDLVGHGEVQKSLVEEESLVGGSNKGNHGKTAVDNLLFVVNILLSIANLSPPLWHKSIHNSRPAISVESVVPVGKLMLAVTGMVWQEYGWHLPGDAYATTDPFEAISSVGFGSNFQTLLAIGVLELANWDDTFNGDGRPGVVNGFVPQWWAKISDAQKDIHYEQEIVHCRLAMIAFIGATHQTFLLHKGLLDFSMPN
jgi:hypothetical protein